MLPRVIKEQDLALAPRFGCAADAQLSAASAGRGRDPEAQVPLQLRVRRSEVRFEPRGRRLFT